MEGSTVPSEGGFGGSNTRGQDPQDQSPSVCNLGCQKHLSDTQTRGCTLFFPPCESVNALNPPEQRRWQSSISPLLRDCTTLGKGFAAVVVGKMD